jgi:hypothetical protein
MLSRVNRALRPTLCCVVVGDFVDPRPSRFTEAAPTLSLRPRRALNSHDSHIDHRRRRRRAEARGDGRGPSPVRPAPPSASLLLAAHQIKAKRALFNEIAYSGENTRSAAESRRT